MMAHTDINEIETVLRGDGPVSLWWMADRVSGPT